MTERQSPDSGPSQPRSEPEIIPPGRSGRSDPAGIWISLDQDGGTQRVYMARPSLFTIIVALALLGIIAAVMLIVLLSVAVIWIPVVIVLTVTFLLSVVVRQYWWRFRSWLGR
jgi:hypothetical protein